MNEQAGWLLDVYADASDGDLVIWFLDDQGERRRLRQVFPVTFYAAGPVSRLRLLWSYLADQEAPLELDRAERRDLFYPQPLTVLKAQVLQAGAQPGLFYRVVQDFPDLDYYDADLPILARYAAAYDIFPLTRCRFQFDEQGWIKAVASLESRWELDTQPPPLRILEIEPECDPFHALPGVLFVRCRRYTGRLSFKPGRALLASLAGILRRCDPDLILSRWGDTWLLPHLLELSGGQHELLPLNRDPVQEAVRKKERTYHAYGRVIYRGQQVLLNGRWHIDRSNAMMYSDYGLEGVFELARVSGLPVQVAARNSPGAGITAMQMIVALRQGILVPYQKQQTEGYKSAQDLIRLDQGGLVYQPVVGLHQDVGEIDFISMYPSIMSHFNISPENMGPDRLAEASIEGLDGALIPEQPGLLPQTLAPLLKKRIKIKEHLAPLHSWDCRYKPYKAQASALKWLLVVSFGYTGYKNAKFGKIEAHQAITAYAREVLLIAKETAEALGFTVLHMYVDGLWVKKAGARRVEDFGLLLEEITVKTGLPIALDGIFKWIAFLPSRLDERVPVPNRYFGVFQSGEIKTRGIEARRHDTPAFIAQAQTEMLQLLAKISGPEELPAVLPQVITRLRKRLRDLRDGKVAAEQLVVRQTLSRALDEYHVPSPAALAAGQLSSVQKHVRVGQSVRFLFTRGDPKVVAWDLPERIPEVTIDASRYAELLLRAAAAVLQPFEISEPALRGWLFNNASAIGLPGLGPARPYLAWPGR